MGIVKAAGIEDAQQTAYRQLRDAHRAKMDLYRTQNSQIRRQLFDLLAQNDEKVSQVQELTDLIATVKRQEELLAFEHFRRVREICRPGQLARFDAAIGEAVQSMGPPGPPRR